MLKVYYLSHVDAEINEDGEFLIPKVKEDVVGWVNY
jgi:hypothetical protein